MSVDRNFVPKVRCPYCSTSQSSEISGWGRTGLNIREKICKNCGESFKVLLLVEAVEEKEVPSDLHIRSMRDRIKYYKRRIKEVELKLENRIAELAKELIRIEASTGGRQN